MPRRKPAKQDGHAAGRSAPSQRRSALAFGVTFLAIALTAGLWLMYSKFSGSPLVGGRRVKPLSIVLITADTLGADQLGCYGNHEIATPNLDDLGRSGLLFEHATTSVPLTLPAHASLLTGTYPMYHGVRDNGGYLAPQHETLAKVLKRLGYATGAFVGSFVLDRRWGLGPGFDRYVDDFDLSQLRLVTPDAIERRGDEVLHYAFEWLDTVRDKPFFAWIHLYDPHAPYNPPEPYRNQYGGRPWGLYHGEVAYVDDLVGQVVRWLDENRLAERTVLAFVGDHGESLGRHGENSHGFFVYDATLHVPLIIRTPDHRPGVRVPGQVRSIDLMPTLLALLGIASPPSVQGRSLLELVAGRPADPGISAYSESYQPRYEYGWSELTSLHDASFHFIDAPEPELYDVRRDPEELHNIAPQDPDVVGRMKRSLETTLARYSLQAPAGEAPSTLDREARERLAALGYVGGGGDADRVRPLVNPREKIALVNLVKEAGADMAAGRLDSAEQRVRTVLASDPNLAVAFTVLGNVCLKRGQTALALDAFRQAVAQDPRNRPALFNLAVAYHDLHNPEAATAALERLSALDPRDTDVLSKLAQLALDAGDRGKAAGLLERVLALDARDSQAEQSLGNIALSEGRLDEAETRFRKALEVDPASLDSHNGLGIVYQRRRDHARAKAEYRAEMAAHAENPRAYLNLGLLCLESGDVEGQLEAFATLVRLSPSSSQANLLFANALLQKNRLKEALWYAERAVSLDPAAQPPRALLQAIHDKLGEQKRASGKTGR